MKELPADVISGSEPRIRFKTIEDFLDAFEAMEQKVIYRGGVARENLSCWFFICQGATFYTYAYDFASIEEAIAAKTAGFLPLAHTAYPERTLDIRDKNNHSLFDRRQNCEVSTVITTTAISFDGPGSAYRYAKAAGFDTYEQFHAAMNMGVRNKETFILFGSSKFPTIEQFLHAQQLGFESYKEYNNAIAGGFLDPLAFKDAKKRGFDYEPVYVEAMAAGFPSNDSYQEAKKQGIQKFVEYELHLQEKAISEKQEAFQQREAKTSEILQTRIALVVDGNDVAWHGRSKEQGKKASAAMLKRLTFQLEPLGFEQIEIFVSRTLRYEIDDLELFEELLRINKITETPPGHLDDHFILSQALQRDALILSNNRYDEWKEQYPYQASQIEFMRAGFTVSPITGEFLFDHKLTEALRSARSGPFAPLSP